jgi:hypothetical protein
MKKTIIILFILISGALNAATYYVATNGNDSNPGTITQPWASWQKGFSSLLPGDILYIRGGNYTQMFGPGHGVKISSRSGTSSSPIRVLAYPGENPVLDCASLSVSAGINFGILMSSSNFWHIKGLTIKNVREYRNLHKSSGGSPTAGWELSNCNDITLELCTVTVCGNGFTLNGTLKNINYINCDAYMNYDYYDSGGLANGFNGNMRGSSTIFYKGCRSWSNSDDGYDNFGGAGYMTYNDCWAWRNGKDTPIIGNGDGFKIGCDLSKTELPGNQRTLYNCVSADNHLMGFDESMDVVTSMDMALYNCIAYKNTRDFGFRFSRSTGTGKTTLRNNISYGNKVNYEGRTRNISDHNTWNSGAPAVSDADFISIDVTQLARSRKSDGSLPDVDFLRLKSTSKMIDAGMSMGLAFSGSAPDMGAFETNMTSTAPAIVTFLSAKSENTTPQIIGVTYSATLANILPAATSYTVIVNSVIRSVSNLAISGKDVLLTLSSPVVYGDVITVAYTKPATNPLQCVGATQAATITAKTVTNTVEPKSTSAEIDDSTKKKISVYPNLVREYMTISNLEPTQGQILKIYDLSGKLFVEQILVAETINRVSVNLKSGIYILKISSGSILNHTQKLVVL